jgi:hypothetical protein
MTVSRMCSLAAAVTAALVLSSIQASAQSPAPPAPVTAVLVDLTIKPGVDAAALAAVMPDEVRDTVLAYLDGKIQQWFGRADGRGVMFILNAHSVAEAEAVMNALPLGKAQLANFVYTPLTPLTPLRRLLSPPPAKGDRQ